MPALIVCCKRVLATFSKATPTPLAEDASPSLLGPTMDEARREHVVEVIDGNTFKTEAHTVRLEGVEAPTLSQPRGLEAKRWLEWLLETGEIVTIEERATDAEGRIITQVWINSTDVNGTMREFLSR